MSIVIEDFVRLGMVRVVRPLPPGIEGFDLSHLRFGASYDIHQPLSDLLLATGYAVPVDDPPALATASVADDRMPTTKRKAAPRPSKLKQSIRDRNGSVKR